MPSTSIHQVECLDAGLRRQAEAERDRAEVATGRVDLLDEELTAARVTLKRLKQAALLPRQAGKIVKMAWPARYPYRS